MFLYAIVAIIIFIVAFVIYSEYKNEQAYKKEKKERNQRRKNSKTSQNYNSKKTVEKEKKKETKPKVATPAAVINIKPKEIKEKTYNLPKCKYPTFNFERLLSMGLSENEAIEFTQELIPQIKTQIPLIQEAIDKEDFQNIERLTHSIKGSSTTVGTGGVSDLLVEFNTYLKSGKELPVINEYIKYLKQYSQDLEKQFS